jgi:hypothetical protein
MTYLLTFAGGLAAGYVLAVYTWPTLRAVFAEAEAEISRFRAVLEDKARDVFGSRG